MNVDEEQRYLQEMVEIFDGALPSRPKGWLGPGGSETFETPRLLREIGFTYLLDWCCDDQPFPLTIPGMISVPYSCELNDFGKWMTAIPRRRQPDGSGLRTSRARPVRGAAR